MKDKIHFEDLRALHNVLPAAAGAVLSLVFGTLVVIKEPTIWYVVPAIIGIALLGIPQIKNVRQRNTIKHNNSGLTAKLLGFKTFGFQYQEIETVQLLDTGLLIKIKEMDVVTLSQKRYQQQSLQQLYTLIHQKTTQL